MEKLKEVFFECCLYCVHYKKTDGEYPCNECLATPARQDSHIPMHFENPDYDVYKLSQKVQGL